MHRRLLVKSVVAAAAVAVTSASPAFAQRANGPYAGVLGGAPDAQQLQGLDLRGSLDGGWDDDIYSVSDPAADGDSRLRENGTSTGVSGSLTYNYRGDRLRFTSTGATSARRYAQTPDLLAAYQGGASLGADLARRVSVTASGDAAYSPFYGFSPLAGAGGQSGSFGPTIDPFSYAALAQRNESFGGAAGITTNLTKRTTFTVDGTAREWRLLDTNQNDLRIWGAHAMLRHKVTRQLGVHAGYGRDQNQYSFTGIGRYDNSTIDAGVDYGDSLTIGRRAAFSFASSIQGVKYGGETHYRAAGQATITRGMGRSWSSWASYNRSTDYQIGFLKPLLNDMASAGVSGLAALNLRWSASFAGTWGSVGFDGDRYHTYSASVRVDRAVARHLAVFGQYLYFNYDVPGGSTVWAVVPHFSRQVATAGLTLWVPIVNDVRPPKDPEQR